MHFAAICVQIQEKSVQLLAEKAMKRLEKEKKELERVQGMIDFEREIAGSTIYCGIDEAGRDRLRDQLWRQLYYAA